MRRVLLIDRSGEDAQGLKTAMLRRGFDVRIEDQRWRATQVLRQPLPACEFVVIVAGSIPENDVALLQELIAATQQLHQSDNPEFLFIACGRHPPTLRLRIGELGARYVRL